VKLGFMSGFVKVGTIQQFCSIIWIKLIVPTYSVLSQNLI
jgi:hypothetical protein